MLLDQLCGDEYSARKAAGGQVVLVREKADRETLRASLEAPFRPANGREFQQNALASNRVPGLAQLDERGNRL